MYNQITLLGRLANDGESKTLQSGTEVYNNTIVTSYKYKDKEETCFLEFQVFGGLCSVFNQYLNKGSQVLLVGRLSQQSWEKDGQKRSKHILVVNDMKMLGSKRENNQNPPVVYEGQVLSNQEQIPF